MVDNGERAYPQQIGLRNCTKEPTDPRSPEPNVTDDVLHVFTRWSVSWASRIFKIRSRLMWWFQTAFWNEIRAYITHEIKRNQPVNAALKSLNNFYRDSSFQCFNLDLISSHAGTAITTGYNVHPDKLHHAKRKKAVNNPGSVFGDPLAGFVPVFYVADIATVALLEGIFISLFSISTSTFMRRGLVSRPAWAIFILSIISFIVATFFACLIVRTVVHIQHVLVDSNDQVILREINIHSSKTLYILNLTSVWCWAVLSTINDIVIVWRTRVLFPETRWVMIGPSFVLLATIASTYTYVGYTVKFILFNPGDVDQRTVKALLVSRYHMIVTTDALSLTTNAVATSLIAFKLWSHRRFIVKNLGHGGRWSRVQSVLFLLVESGLVSGGIQLINLIFEATPRLRQSLPKQILSSALPGLTGMYPTIVAVLAHRRRSSTDTYGFSDMNISHGGGINTRTRSRSTVIGHLTFASPVPGLVTSDVRAFPVAVQDPLSRYDGSEDEARLENALTKQEDNGLGHCVPSTISS